MNEDGRMKRAWRMTVSPLDCVPVGANAEDNQHAAFSDHPEVLAFNTLDDEFAASAAIFCAPRRAGDVNPLVLLHVALI